MIAIRIDLSDGPSLVRRFEADRRWVATFTDIVSGYARLLFRSSLGFYWLNVARDACGSYAVKTFDRSLARDQFARGYLHLERGHVPPGLLD